MRQTARAGAKSCELASREFPTRSPASVRRQQFGHRVQHARVLQSQRSRPRRRRGFGFWDRGSNSGSRLDGRARRVDSPERRLGAGNAGAVGGSGRRPRPLGVAGSAGGGAVRRHGDDARRVAQVRALAATQGGGRRDRGHSQDGGAAGGGGAGSGGAAGSMTGAAGPRATARCSIFGDRRDLLV